MPAPLLRRRWFRVLLGLAAVVIVLPTLVYVFGGPGAREAIEKLAAELPDDPRPEVTAALRDGGAR